MNPITRLRHIKSVISELNGKELKRILASVKEYVFFDVSVFNVGVAVSIKCTDKYKEIRDCPYSFILTNDHVLQGWVKTEISKRKNGQREGVNNG